MYLSPMGSPKRVTIVDIADDHKVLGEIPFDNTTRPPTISKDEKFLKMNLFDRDQVPEFEIIEFKR